MEIDLEQDIPNNCQFSFNNINQINNAQTNNDSKKEYSLFSFSNNTLQGNECIGKFDSKRVIKETNPSTFMSSCERRLIKDIDELKKNENIGKVCKIYINDYKRINNSNNYQMIIEFKNFFSVKFIFPPEYPFIPPTISYHSGIKFPFVFDSDGIINLENANKSNWTPILWLSTLVNSIELLILKGLNSDIYNSNKIMFIPKKMKYGKRKWDEYLKEEKELYKNNISIINQISRTIKGFKSLSL
jgi:ubiquitin-protein ligase